MPVVSFLSWLERTPNSLYVLFSISLFVQIHLVGLSQFQQSLSLSARQTEITLWIFNENLLSRLQLVNHCTTRQKRLNHWGRLNHLIVILLVYFMDCRGFLCGFWVEFCGVLFLLSFFLAVIAFQTNSGRLIGFRFAAQVTVFIEKVFSLFFDYFEGGLAESFFFGIFKNFWYDFL